MKKGICVLMSVFAIFGLVLYLSACGGGGDSGSGDDGGGTTGDAGVYSYPLDRAGVSEALTYVEDLGIGCSMETPQAISNTMRSVSDAIRGVTDQIVVQKIANLNSRNLLDENIDQRIEDECVGSNGYLDVLVTDNGSAMSADVSFNGFCLDLGDMDNDGVNDEAVINGGAAFDANYVETAEGGVSSMSLSGGTGPAGITVNILGETASLQLSGLSLSMRDPEEQDCQMGADATMSSFSLGVPAEGGGTETVSLSNVDFAMNEYYDAAAGECGVRVGLGATITTDDGTLRIDTPTPIAVDGYGDIDAGGIQLQGADGASVMISFMGASPYEFEVNADTDGDGTADESFGTMDCSGISDALPEIE